MKKIREGVFETNSSSMHSFTTSDGPELNVREVDGNLELSFGEFGWGYDRYISPQDFAEYIATYLFKNEDEGVINEDGEYTGSNEKIKNFEEILKENTGASSITYSKSGSYSVFGYVDHQSRDVAEEMANDIYNSIFKGRELEINNDND